MKYQIKSILEQIASKVFQMKDLQEAKNFIAKFVEDKNINDKDKKDIIRNVRETTHINALYKYLSNALLKFEGLGMNQINKTAREVASETEKNEL